MNKNGEKETELVWPKQMKNMIDKKTSLDRVWVF